MSSHVVRVRAPSRLHFGMLSFGDATVRQYGGVGVMIDAPGIELTLSPSRHLAIDGPHQKRIETLVRQWARYRGRPAPPACELHVAAAPRQHVGLGTGTQLALSVAAGLDVFHDLPRASASDLARSVGRGQRSAVGTYGFYHGGLIAELGKWKDQSLAPLERQIGLPAAWRFVLLIPKDQMGLSGQAEQQAFDAMRPVPHEVTQQLLREMHERLLPSAEREDFEKFGESIYRYGIAAGRCFTQRQAGAFASPRLEKWVEMIREMGVRGVGQSSWGPTLFALLAGESEATHFVRQLRQQLETEKVQLMVAPVNSGGASCTKDPVA